MWFRHHEKTVVNQWWHNYYKQSHGVEYPGFDPNKTQWISSSWHWAAKILEEGAVSYCGESWSKIQTIGRMEDLKRNARVCYHCRSAYRLMGV